MMDRKLLRIGGICALVFAVVMAAFAAYITSVIGALTAECKEILQNVGEAHEALRWFQWGGTLDWLLVIPVVLALYFVLRDREPAYAVLALVALLLAVPVMLISQAGGPIIGWKLGETYVGGTAAEKTMALLIGESVGRWVDMTGLVVGMILVALGNGMFGLAMLTSHSFPRWLGWVGIVGGGLSLIGQLSWFSDPLVVIVFVGWLVMLGWVFITGIYLLRIKPVQN